MFLRSLGVFFAFGLTATCLTAQAAPAGRGRDRAVIQGVVFDTLGRAVAGTRVYLFIDSVVPSLSEGGRVRFKWPVATRESDNSGRIAFGPLKPGFYTLRTFSSSIEAELDSITVGGNDTVTTRLVLSRRIAPGSPTATRSRHLAQLTRAELRWAGRGVSRYRLTARLDCYCSAPKEGPATLEFWGDSLSAVIEPKGRATSTPFLPWWKAFSVPSLFAAAESEIRDPRRVVFSIVYDSTYGVPTLISTDTNQHMPDLWLRYWVDAFRVVRR